MKDFEFTLENKLDDIEDKQESWLESISKAATEAAKNTPPARHPITQMIDQGVVQPLLAPPENDAPITEEERAASSSDKPDDGSVNSDPRFNPLTFSPVVGMYKALTDPTYLTDWNRKKQVTPVEQLTDEQLMKVAGGGQEGTVLAVGEADPTFNPAEATVEDFNLKKAWEASVAKEADVDPNRIEAARVELLLRSRQSKKTLPENLMDGDFTSKHADILAKLAVTSPYYAPADAVTMAATIAAVPSAFLGFGTENFQSVADYAMETRREVNRLMGQEDPKTWLQSAAQIAPAASIVFPRTATSSILRNGIELALPATFGASKGRVGANVGFQFFGNEAIQTAMVEEEEAYKSLFENFKQNNPNFDLNIIPAAEAEGNDQKLSEELTRTIIGTTPAGVALTDHDVFTYGTLGAITIGLMGGPAAFRAMRNHLPSGWFTPTMKNPELDVYGLHVDPMSQGDYTRTFLFDTNEGMISATDRVLGEHLDSSKAMMNQNAQSAMRVKIGTALDTGTFRSNDARYDVQRPVKIVQEAYASFSQQERRVAAHYMDMKNRVEKLAISVNEKMFDPVELGTFKVWDQFTLKEMQDRIKVLETQHPWVKEFDQGYTDLTRAAIRTAESGEFATIDKATAQRAYANPHNYSYDSGPKEVAARYSYAKDFFRKSQYDKKYLDGTHKRKYTGEGDDRNIPSGYDNIDLITAGILRHRAENEVKGRFIDDVLSRKGGEKLFYKLDEDEVVGEYDRKRVVTVFRNGKKERYVTNQAFADILRMDPSVIHYDWMAKASRGFQNLTTGAGNPMFAPKRIVRDTSIMQVNTPVEYPTLGFSHRNLPLPYVDAAHVEMGIRGIINPLWAEMGLGFQKWVERGVISSHQGRIMGTIAGSEPVRALARGWANKVYKSNYYMLKKYGAIDVSTQTAILDYSKKRRVDPIGAIREQDLEHINSYKEQLEAYKENAGAVQHRVVDAYINLFDIVSNAPTYASIDKATRRLQRQLGRDLKPEEVEKVVSDIRPAAGDPTRSGRGYVQDMGAKGNKRRLGADPHDPKTDRSLDAAAYIFDVLRETTPWANATIKGIEASAKAYYRNPIQWTMRAWTSMALPNILAYALTYAAGPEFMKYKYEQRSDYDQATNIYLPPVEAFFKEGVKPETGFEVPMNLELGWLGYLTDNGMDFFFRPGGGRHSDKVMQHIWDNYLELPRPPMLKGAAALVGYNIGDGVFGNVDDHYETSYKGTPLQRTVKDFNLSNGDMLMGAAGGAAATMMTKNNLIRGGAALGSAAISNYLNMATATPEEAEAWGANIDLFLKAMGGTAMQVGINTYSAGYDADFVYDEDGFVEEAGLGDRFAAAGRQLEYELGRRAPIVANKNMSTYGNSIVKEAQGVLDRSERLKKAGNLLFYNQNGAFVSKDDLVGGPQKKKGTAPKVAFTITAPTENIPGMIAPPSIPFSMIERKSADHKLEPLLLEDKETGEWLLVPRWGGDKYGDMYLPSKRGAKIDGQKVSGRKKDREWMMINNFGRFDSKENAESYRDQLVKSAGEMLVVPGTPDEEWETPLMPGQSLRDEQYFRVENWIFAQYNDHFFQKFSKKYNKYNTIKGQYFATAKQIGQLRDLNEGNLIKWEAQLARMPEGAGKELLKSYKNLDMDARRDLMNQLSKQQVELAKLINSHRDESTAYIKSRLQSDFGIVADIDWTHDLDPYTAPRIPQPAGSSFTLHP